MTTFVEDHLGSLSIVVVMKSLSAEPAIAGVSYTTEDVNNKVIRTGALATKIVLTPGQQEKLDNFFAHVVTVAQGELGLTASGGSGGPTTGQGSVTIRGITVSVGNKISINGIVFTVINIVGTTFVCKTAGGRVELHNGTMVNFHLVG